MASVQPTFRQIQLERVSYPAMEETCDFSRKLNHGYVQECEKTIPFLITEQSYRLQTVLGKGTFGTVTLAKQKSTGSLVAIKTLKGCEHINPLDLREVQFFRCVAPHPSLVHMSEMYIDSLTSEVNFVLEVMEFNMLDLIHARRGTLLDPVVISSLSNQLLQGISHIHAHEFVHRDIKPENLLLSYDSREKCSSKGLIVKIADFGLSRRVSEHDIDVTWSGYVATRWYRAPEQLLQAPNHGYSLDIWAFGTVLAELCNLKPLFPGKDLYEMLNLQLRVLGSPCQSNFSGSWPQKPGSRAERHLEMLKERQTVAKPNVVFSRHMIVFDKIVKACLRWDPRRRPAPEQLLQYLNTHKIAAAAAAAAQVEVPHKLVVHGRSHSIG